MAFHSGRKLHFATDEKLQKDSRNETTLQDLKAPLEEVGRFRTLLFELSAKFASLSVGEIDGEIENGLELVEKLESPATGAARMGPEGSLHSVERAHISKALEQTGWVVDGPRGAARILNSIPRHFVRE